MHSFLFAVLLHQTAFVFKKFLPSFVYVYTGGVEEYLNYRGQLHDCFPDVDFQGTLDVEYYRDADHTYTSLLQRHRMFDRVEGWIRRSF